jgi:hypothetical protein
VSQAANSRAEVVRVACTARRSRRMRGSARSVSPAASSFWGSQPPDAATTSSASSVAASAGASAASSGAG